MSVFQKYRFAPVVRAGVSRLAASCLAVMSLAPGAGLIGPASAQVQSVTPAQAYADGCGGCHASERRVLRAIPRGSEAEQRAWLVAFMANHPCEHDHLRGQIVEYLLARTK